VFYELGKKLEYCGDRQDHEFLGWGNPECGIDSRSKPSSLDMVTGKVPRVRDIETNEKTRHEWKHGCERKDRENPPFPALSIQDSVTVVCAPFSRIALNRHTLGTGLKSSQQSRMLLTARSARNRRPFENVTSLIYYFDEEALALWSKLHGCNEQSAG